MIKETRQQAIDSINRKLKIIYDKLDHLDPLKNSIDYTYYSNHKILLLKDLYGIKNKKWE
jgi:hypothetical protein